MILLSNRFDSSNFKYMFVQYMFSIIIYPFSKLFAI